jgi:hypothetical protein
MNAEQRRLEESRLGRAPWKKWGPYLSERQWGTVREDYSANGDAWNYLNHDQARFRAYRWGEDGLAGVSDDRQLLCFALALWNGRDPILKERLFGLANHEGNHGEDVKECYFYLDSTPTHSYMKYLYKYPQAAYPYNDIVLTNRHRDRLVGEYELLDTGVFNDRRYFDVFVEYAKADPEDLLIHISICNRGPDPATIHVLPTLWFRNRWSWGGGPPVERPVLQQVPGTDAVHVIAATDALLGRRFLYAGRPCSLLFTENESSASRLVHAPNAAPYVKVGINDFIVHGKKSAVSPTPTGTKASCHYVLEIPAGQSADINLRLTDTPPDAAFKAKSGPLGATFDKTLAARRADCDEFYASIIPPSLDPSSAAVMRQALAGMLWSKQFFYYDLHQWLTEHGANPFRPELPAPRNRHWHHMLNADIISMPDKWEYPWYAAWDLAFHVLALTLVDEDFGKEQLSLMLQSNYQHPNGQLPAYEWNFSDVNPPVHAWAAVFTYRLEKASKGRGDVAWLDHVFQKLLMNFTWWVNRKDRNGSNVFEGGFLGLDNIGVFDRSAPLPGGGYLDQADGTAWMALFCQNMLEIAAELASDRPAFDLEILQRFLEHFLWIASSMVHSGHDTGMWDENDGFFYDVLRGSDGSTQRLKVRSMVGLLPLCAVTIFDGKLLTRQPAFLDRIQTFLAARPELLSSIHDVLRPGAEGRYMASVLNESRLRRVLSALLDESEFLSPFGIRSLSRFHADHPYVLSVNGQEFSVAYNPADSNSGLFGGNSNWRGPIWMPVNALIIRALLQYYMYYGDSFTIECPTGSGRHMTLYQVAEELSRRLTSIFLPDKNGRRPVHGSSKIYQDDPHWRDLLLYYEYFHGDTGAGLGANHQTGWTGLVARMMHLFATTTPRQALELGKQAAVTEASTPVGNVERPRRRAKRPPRPLER